MTIHSKNAFGALAKLDGAADTAWYYRLAALEEAGLGQVSRLPYSIRVLLESLLRNVDGYAVTEEDVARLSAWDALHVIKSELPFKPSRVILQDLSGVPAVVDLAAMRSAMHRLGGTPSKVNPIIPVDLVIDHSVQVDMAGSPAALLFNAEREFERNRERYEFLKWGQGALDNFRAVPPATGIIHQVNLEYLATVVREQQTAQGRIVFPDCLVGTDSHTTMINGLGVLGWGVGGIEAEAVMLGQPIYLLTPEVVGFRLSGNLPEGATATDLVLTVTQLLRAHGVVDKFVEFFGPGVDRLSLPDRATLANMAPEYGATMGFFPVDAETLRYLRVSGRSAELVEMVERYTKAQGLFRTDQSPDPVYTDVLELDMGSVAPSVAGPKRPQDRMVLGSVPGKFAAIYPQAQQVASGARVEQGGHARLQDGDIVIAAITSCTNTSNPSVMVAAGLLAKHAVERGLQVRPWVKTSLAPGSKVVTEYLNAAGLTPYLEQLGFYTVGYGCTTCIGNSGPLSADVAEQIRDRDLVAAAVLSGNRNFEGRIHALVKANYLASPPLVVAYAIAGNMMVDLTKDPLGHDADGHPVYLREIWPSQEEIQTEIDRCVRPEMFESSYGKVLTGNEMWNRVRVPEGDLFEFGEDSTYILEPPFFANLTREVPAITDIVGARALAVLGDSVTTDHISPAGAIAENSPAGSYLVSRGIAPVDFNTYGSRRGNHEVLMRGTFANTRIRNRLVPGVEGGYTTYLPTGERMPIYDAAMRYAQDGTPLIIIAGKEYGTGSSRDWAGKGPSLLGVRVVLAESYERIHRSNLVGMGVLPLQFQEGDSASTLGLNGDEVFEIVGLAGGALKPRQLVTVRAVSSNGDAQEIQAISRIDTPVEVDYYLNGGILQTVLRKMLAE